MSSSDCIVKQYGCSCPPDTCSAQSAATTAPVISFSWRDHLVLCLTAGFIAGIVAFAIAARAEPYFKRQALEQQESTRHG